MDRNLSKTRRGRGADAERDAGFTLIELLVVLSIIVLLGGIVAPQVLRYLGSARTEAAQTQIRNIESALELFLIDNFRYPTTEEGLDALAEPTPALAARWKGPYLQNADALVDPWGAAYIYESDDGAVRITSFGRDGSPGGEGEDRDISNIR
ncbi:type II secretion system major pseudopilin GspG [Jannaschia sp. KMU-145]|uniref:type II secretion system major pseudopilin GspG n=1 Tax=Jannaschia halovivens TaxID=3388667 RepID=UPI00396B013E